MTRRILVLAALAALVAAAPASADRPSRGDIEHVVVIYQENHSFDNLYGEWEGVDGLDNAPARRTRQVNQAGKPYRCLLQNDVNLASPPQPADCTDNTTATTFTSHFPNAPFSIDDYIPATAKTCPIPGQPSAPNGVPKGQGAAGGCTRDLVHRFYQEQYQLDDGRQDRYVTGSDAVGLTMGHYDTRELPIYRYLHERGHPHYAIADRFFQAAFGGSFLNHQWLIAAASPVFYNAVADDSANDLHSLVDSNGMPTSYPLYTATGPVKDAPLTQKCTPPPPKGLACGDYAVNTIQPAFQPYVPGTPAERRLPPQRHATIGDRLNAAHVSWAWYSGGWSNANGAVGEPGWTNGTGPAPATPANPTPCPDANALPAATWPNCPDRLFQFHHQPFNYFASFAPGTVNRARHLRDEAEFLQQADASQRRCRLEEVSFIKPVGAENEHPGYASEPRGSDHLVDLIQAVQDSSCADDTMVVVTYDEFGGQWDHVSPPGQGGRRGVHDNMGPGTRIPALVIAPNLRSRFVVDHTPYDTTSIMATLERMQRLRPLTSRDAAVNDLRNVFDARPPRRR